MNTTARYRRAMMMLATLALASAPQPASAGVCDPCCKDMDDPSACTHREAKSTCGEGGHGVGCQNGCGPGGFLDSIISAFNRSSGADFLPACNKHDNCYNNCGLSRDFCDEQFLGRLEQACEQAWPGQGWFLVRAWCQVVARHDYLFVRFAGAAWTADQQAFCRCCDACSAAPVSVDFQTDAANCGACGHACDSGASCCGAACVDTKTDASNCGACGHACDSGLPCRDGQCQPCPAAPCRPSKWTGTASLTVLDPLGGTYTTSAQVTWHLVDPQVIEGTDVFEPVGNVTHSVPRGCTVDPASHEIKHDDGNLKVHYGTQPLTYDGEAITTWFAACTCPDDPDPKPFFCDAGGVWFNTGPNGPRPVSSDRLSIEDHWTDSNKTWTWSFKGE